MSGIGHNRGPTMEPGAGWRRHAWGRARAELLPQMPLEIVRIRVRRAQALGLDYRTYATVRATTGRDIIAFLFSSNALRLDGRGVAAPARADTAARAAAERVALVHPPIDPSAVIAANAPLLAAADAAPRLDDSWRAHAARIDALRTRRGLPRDGVLVIGETTLERDWCAAGRLAGFVAASRFFAETRP